jgi:hypothetical protein
MTKKRSYIVIHDSKQDDKVISKWTPKQSRDPERAAWTAKKLEAIHMWREQRYPNIIK